MSADEKTAEFLEVTVVLVLDFRNTPEVFTSLNNTAIESGHILRATDDAERHGGGENTSVFRALLIVGLNWRGIDTDALGVDDITNALLEQSEVVLREGISFGNNGNEIDTSAEALHDLNVEGLERMPSWPNEIQASVNTQVTLFFSLRLLFLPHI